MSYDVAIIGGGIVGCSCAYYLSKYDVKVVMLEKENDVSMGASRANSAIIHAGFDPEPNTLMAKLNVRGTELSQEICKKLSVKYKKIGSLVIAKSDDDMKMIKILYDRGVKNGVPDMEIWDKDKLNQKEKNICDDAIGALFAPSAAIVNPWEYSLAMAETAVLNGAKVELSFNVKSIKKEDDYYIIKSENKEIKAKYIINASGVNADKITSMVSKPSYKIVPTAGEYYLLDKSEGGLVNSVIFPCPSKEGKGVLISPTVHGNLIVGPNAVVREDNEDTSCTASGLSEVKKKSTSTVKNINFRQNIRNFTGIRANSTADDFIIEFSAEHFLSLAGIKSPGLSAAPAIAEYAIELLKKDKLKLTNKIDFIDRRYRVHFNELNDDEKKKIINKDALYGRVICRCETVTEGEIIDAIHSPIKPVSIDGIKRRTGAGMGRCQGGFCAPRVVDIMARELKISPMDVLLDKDGSNILIGQTKGDKNNV